MPVPLVRVSVLAVIESVPQVVARVLPVMVSVQLAGVLVLSVIETVPLVGVRVLPVIVPVPLVGVIAQWVMEPVVLAGAIVMEDIKGGQPAGGRVGILLAMIRWERIDKPVTNPTVLPLKCVLPA